MILIFRNATQEDSDFLFDIRNDDLTRKNSHNSDLVSIDGHNQWLNSSLKNKNRMIFIAEENGIKLGVGRIDRLKDEDELSWTVSPDHRGKGFGVKIVEFLLKTATLKTRAEIKKHNIPSINIAKKAGMSVALETQDLYVFTM